jgi:hypothetical protein
LLAKWRESIGYGEIRREMAGCETRLQWRLLLPGRMQSNAEARHAMKEKH